MESISPPLRSGRVYCAFSHRMWWKRHCGISGQSPKLGWQFPIPASWNVLSWDAPFWSQPPGCEEAHHTERPLGRQPPLSFQTARVRSLHGRPAQPSLQSPHAPPTSDCNHSGPQVKTTQRAQSTRRTAVTINCCLKPLSPGVAYYIPIDTQMSHLLTV